MIHFLALQSTYSTLEIALFKNDTCLALTKIDKITASKETIIALDTLLKEHSCSLHDIAFLAVNHGPGPFTTLRVVIATANGLSFANNIPLVGINGLQALLHEHPCPSVTIALLNAFHQDVYYGIRREHNQIEYGCTAINDLISNLSASKKTPILFIGNGAQLHGDMIKAALGNQATFLERPVETASIQQIGILGWQQWQAKKGLSDQLQPLYFKQARF